MGSETESFSDLGGLPAPSLPPRLPEETERSYGHFIRYLRIPSSERTIHEYARRADMSKGHIERLAAQYKWVDRANKFDIEAAKRSIVFREVGADAFKMKVDEDLTAATSMLKRVLMGKIEALVELAEVAPDEVDTQEIDRMVRALDKVDLMARRAAQMPTEYRKVAEVEYDAGEVFVIGE